MRSCSHTGFALTAYTALSVNWVSNGFPLAAWRLETNFINTTDNYGAPASATNITIWATQQTLPLTISEALCSNGMFLVRSHRGGNRIATNSSHVDYRVEHLTFLGRNAPIIIQTIRDAIHNLPFTHRRGMTSWK